MKRLLLVLCLLLVAVPCFATDFDDTDQLYGWDSATGQFYQTWLAHKTQLGLVYQGLDTQLTELAGVTPVNDALLGFNGTGNIEAKSTVSINVDLGVQSSTTAGRLGRTTGDKITMGNNAGAATLEFSDDVANAAAYHPKDGALNTSGTIQGLVASTLDTAATITLASTDVRGAWRFNGDNDVIDYTLPAVAAGMSVCIGNITFAQVITIDVDSLDYIILDGVALTQGNAIDSPGAATAEICFIGIDSNYWKAVGKVGTWVDGGAD